MKLCVSYIECFAPVTLTLTLTLTYELDLHLNFLKMYLHTKNVLLGSKLFKVRARTGQINSETNATEAILT